MSELRIEQVYKRYSPANPVVLNGLDLRIPSGSTVSLLGQSGCGKTTLLRIIAGFTDPNSGSVRSGSVLLVDEKRSVVPEKRSIGFVFQDFALFPHMNVVSNIGYGLPRLHRRERAEEMLSFVGLSGYGKRYPHELSGGQQQRVAIARALAPGPRLLLMDEPFNNLDAGIKSEMLAYVKRVLDSQDITTIIVSHDFHEAEQIADMCAVIDEGKVVQFDTVEQVKRNPVNTFVRRITHSDYSISPAYNV